MKTMLVSIFATATLTLAAQAGAVDADKAQALTKANGCMACHSVSTKLVGPSYEEVAAKYAGDADGEAKLIAKVKDGGSGVWGPVPMPPHPSISDDDLKTMVDWVLSLKK